MQRLFVNKILYSIHEYVVQAEDELSMLTQLRSELLFFFLIYFEHLNHIQEDVIAENKESTSEMSKHTPNSQKAGIGKKRDILKAQIWKTMKVPNISVNCNLGIFIEV